MALDKQKILNELGNVVNQLQSADCGCMGKLFNSGSANPNINPMSGPYGGAGMRGCHGHGCNAFNSPCAGEPCPGARRCMGFCNSPKLYADTYSYLNQNLMQPVVQEVYEDLKSISPANTVMNNPMAAQMGLSQPNNPNQAPGNMMAPNSMPGAPMENPMGQKPQPHLHFGNMDMNSLGANNTQMNNLNMQQGMGQEVGQGMGQMNQGMVQGGLSMGQPAQQMGQRGMGGMGPQIMNMMSSSAKSNMMNQGGPSMNATGDVLQSPGVGQMASNKPGDMNQGNFVPGQMQSNSGYMGHNNMGHGNMGVYTTQHMTQSNPQGGSIPGNANQTNIPPQQMGNMNQMSVPAQRVGNMNANPQMSAYGQHSAGLAKFNEMFPGMMKGDLGFDPMAIAIQMNPANQQQSAIDTMSKMMMNNSSGINKILDATGKPTPAMQSVVNATNTASASVAQSNQLPPNQVPVQQNINQVPVQQQPGVASASVPMQNNQIPQQQVYTALTGAPTINQQLQPQQLQMQQRLPQQPSDQIQQHYQPTQQQMVNSNAGGLPTVYEGTVDDRQEQPPAQREPQKAPAQQPIYKDPIFPADTSRNLLLSHHFAKPQKFYQYNTLGQPVEMLPAKHNPAEIPDLPQTLGGKEIPRYSNVKATVSKTALIGNRAIGKIPSRNQLQHIYNQYKGSQSFTQQNIKPSNYNGSYSEGHINVPNTNAPRQTPIERVGGDTVANTQHMATKLEPYMDQVGDVPVNNKPPGEDIMTPAKHAKLRNGLQDQVFSTYPGSAKWSFHGSTPVPFSVGYRFKKR